jgi:TRAP-type C4-dicarboxylate transport system permease small subunit
VKALLDRLANATLASACIALLLIAAIQAWQVFARYVLNDSAGWTEPLALLLMNTAMMFGAAVGVRRDQHFSFPLLVDRVPTGARRVLRSIALAIPGAIGIALALGGAVLMGADWDVPMAGAAMPEGLRYLPLCVGGGLIALFATERLVDVWRGPADSR